MYVSEPVYILISVHLEKREQHIPNLKLLFIRKQFNSIIPNFAPVTVLLILWNDAFVKTSRAVKFVSKRIRVSRYEK